MGEDKYNKSHAVDLVPYEAIKKADKMPYHIKGFITATKKRAEALNLKLEKRIEVTDLETGRTWK